MLYVLQIDAITSFAHNIPGDSIAVAGYDTGPGIAWAPGQWDWFPRASKVHFDQSPGLTEFAPGRSHAARVSNTADIEAGAATIESFIAAARIREAAGLQSTAYIDMAEYPDLVVAVAKAKVNGVRYGIADWSLSASQAQNALEKNLEWVFVQFASPTSNPHTEMPGLGMTLAEANCDLSVKRADWFPAPGLAASTWTE